MNWVGGVRTRVRGPHKSDKKIQKEFFERKRLRHLYHSEAKRSDSERETSSKQKPVKVSQDILEFQRQQKLNKIKDPDPAETHFVKVVNLDGKTHMSRGVNMFGRVNAVELPVSPIKKPSALSLSYTPQPTGSSHSKRQAPISMKSFSQNLGLYSKDNIQSSQNGCIDLFGKTIKKPVSKKRPTSAPTREPYLIDSALATRESYPMATTNDAVDLNNFPSDIYSSQYNGLMNPADNSFSIEAGNLETVSSLNLHQFKDRSNNRLDLCNPLASNLGVDIDPFHYSQCHMINQENFSPSQHCHDQVLNTSNNADTFKVSVIDSPESKRSISSLSKDSLRSYLHEPNVDISRNQYSPKVPSSDLTQFLQNSSHLSQTRGREMSNKERDFKLNGEQEYANSSRSYWSPCSVDNFRKPPMASGSTFTWPPRSFDSMLYRNERISENDFENAENQRYKFSKNTNSHSTSYTSDCPAKSDVSLSASSQNSFLVSTGLDYSQQFLRGDNSLPLVSPDSLNSNGCGLHVLSSQTCSPLAYQRQNQSLLNNDIYRQQSCYKRRDKTMSNSFRYSPFVADVYPDPKSGLKQSVKPIKERHHSGEHNSRIEKVTLGSDFSKRYHTYRGSRPAAEDPKLLNSPIKRKHANTTEVLKENTRDACHLVQDGSCTDSEMGLRYEQSGSVSAYQNCHSQAGKQSCDNLFYSANDPSSSKNNEKVPLASEDQSNKDIPIAQSQRESTLKKSCILEISPTKNNLEFTTPKTFKNHFTTADVTEEKLSSGQVTQKIKAIESTPVVIDHISPVNTKNGTKVLPGCQGTVSSNLSALNSRNGNLESPIQGVQANPEVLQRKHKWTLVDTASQTIAKIMKDSCCSPIVELSSYLSEPDCEDLGSNQTHGKSFNEPYCLRSRTRRD